MKLLNFHTTPIVPEEHYLYLFLGFVVLALRILDKVLQIRVIKNHGRSTYYVSTEKLYSINNI